MKNELFKDPFVVMLIAVSAAGNSEKLHRLIFDENFLREHLSTHLEKEAVGIPGNMNVLIETLKNEQWRKDHSLSEYLSISMGQLLPTLISDKELWNKLDEFDQGALEILLKAAVTNLDIVTTEPTNNTTGETVYLGNDIYGLVRTTH